VTVLIDFALNMRTEKYKLGQKIFTTGENAVFFYVIKKGSVKLCFEGLSELPLVEIAEGSYFGEFDLMDKDEEHEQVRSYSCYANEDETEILKISKQVFHDIFISRDRKRGEEFKKFAKIRAQEIADIFSRVERLLKKFESEMEADSIRSQKFRKFQKLVFTEKFRKLVEEILPPETPEKKERYQRSMKKYIAFEKIYKETKFMTRSNTAMRQQQNILSRQQTSRLGRFLRNEAAQAEMEKDGAGAKELEMQPMPMRNSPNRRSEQGSNAGSSVGRSSQQRRRMADNI